MSESSLIHSFDGIALYQLERGHIRLQVTNWGASIFSVQYLSDDGAISDLALTCDSLEEFVVNRCYFGSTVGRSVNRIKNAQFDLGGKTYHLEANDGNSNSHGGFIGFSFRPWETELLSDGIAFHLRSPDGEGGFPGNVAATCIYRLKEDGEIDIQYKVTTDQDTIINITNHTYWSISGSGKNIYSQTLQVDAGNYLAVDDELTPTGELCPVDGTVFDFRYAALLGQRLCPLPVELSRTGGYDVSFVKDSDTSCITLEDSITGRQIKVSSSMPILHIYSGNFLRDIPGKHGKLYQKHDAICTEASYYPDAVHHSNFGFSILKAGDHLNEFIRIRIR